MICPKCEEGKLTEITLKTTNKKGLYCDLCETAWLKGEKVDKTTGHTLSALTIDPDTQYAFDETPVDYHREPPVIHDF